MSPTSKALDMLVVFATIQIKWVIVCACLFCSIKPVRCIAKRGSVLAYLSIAPELFNITYYSGDENTLISLHKNTPVQ
jgi:hypothetical protein